MESKRICPRCKKDKMLSEFFKHSRGRGGFDYHCKECKRLFNHESYLRNKQGHAKRTKKWITENPLRAKKYRQDYYRRTKPKQQAAANIRRIAAYGLTIEQYEKLLSVQGGVCAICKRPPSGKRLAIDHDHRCCKYGLSCGKCVRGLLCFRCNSIIGKNDVAVLRAAIKYLLNI